MRDFWCIKIVIRDMVHQIKSYQMMYICATLTRLFFDVWFFSLLFGFYLSTFRSEIIFPVIIMLVHNVVLDLSNQLALILST